MIPLRCSYQRAAASGKFQYVMENMAGGRENIILLILMLVGAIVVPVLLIWTADNLFALTVKTFVAAFFLLLLLRAVPGRKKESGFGGPQGKDEDT